MGLVHALGLGGGFAEIGVALETELLLGRLDHAGDSGRVNVVAVRAIP